jgi:hypothetical protein
VTAAIHAFFAVWCFAIVRSPGSTDCSALRVYSACSFFAALPAVYPRAVQPANSPEAMLLYGSIRQLESCGAAEYGNTYNVYNSQPTFCLYYFLFCTAVLPFTAPYLVQQRKNVLDTDQTEKSLIFLFD